MNSTVRRPQRLLLLLMSLPGLTCDDSGGSSGVDAGPVDAAANAQCPSALRFTFLAGNRTDVGWTGGLHGSTIARDAFFRVRITECDDECRQCAFEGPILDDVVNTRRCISDTAVTCSSDQDCPNWECRISDPQTLARACAQDSRQACTDPSECGNLGTCRFFIGPPFPILTPRTCLGTFLASTDGRPPVIGTIDRRVGTINLQRMGMLTGVTDSAVQGACPKCIGDPVPNDGQKGGRCVQNDVQPAFPYSADQACDANGVGQPAVFDGNYSLDCSTPLGIRIDLTIIGASTSGDRFTLSSSQPDCGGQPCWCGVCDGTLQPCHQDDDCLGTTCVAPTDIPVRPNACINTCSWDPTTSRGTCMTQDPPQTPGGPLPPPRATSCFPSGTDAVIVAQGRSVVLSDTSYSVTLGNVQCRPPVRSLGNLPVFIESDRLIGLPGPQLSILRFQVDEEMSP